MKLSLNLVLPDGSRAPLEPIDVPLPPLEGWVAIFHDGRTPYIGNAYVYPTKEECHKAHKDLTSMYVCPVYVRLEMKKYPPPSAPPKDK